MAHSPGLQTTLQLLGSCPAAARWLAAVLQGHRLGGGTHADVELVAGLAASEALLHLDGALQADEVVEVPACVQVCVCVCAALCACFARMRQPCACAAMQKGIARSAGWTRGRR